MATSHGCHKRLSKNIIPGEVGEKKAIKIVNARTFFTWRNGKGNGKR